MLERCIADPGSGLKAFLTGLLKELNEDDEEDEEEKFTEGGGHRESRSPPEMVDKAENIEELEEEAAAAGAEELEHEEREDEAEGLRISGEFSVMLGEEHGMRESDEGEPDENN